MNKEDNHVLFMPIDIVVKKKSRPWVFAGPCHSPLTGESLGSWACGLSE